MTRAAESLVTVGGKRPKTKTRITAAQRRKKRRIQKSIAGGVLFMLIGLIWFGVQPLRGNMDYGICRTFAELQASSAATMRIISYEHYGDAWKIFYSYTGPYGEQKSNFIDCTFTTDPAGNRVMREAKINRTEVTKSELRLFNLSIPGIIKAEPDLIIPPPLEETDLQGLRTQ